MAAVVVIIAVVGLAIGWATWYDAKQRRRGVRVRASGAMANEALHHRVDIDAVPYEPARHAGQRDWATYRARDRKPPRR